MEDCWGHCHKKENEGWRIVGDNVTKKKRIEGCQKHISRIKDCEMNQKLQTMY